MAIELTVVFKDEERSYRHKFLLYETFTMSPNDPVITQCINEALEGFQGEPEDIKIQTLMVLQ
jgi:hypothetical protein